MYIITPLTLPVMLPAEAQTVYEKKDSEYIRVLFD